MKRPQLIYSFIALMFPVAALAQSDIQLVNQNGSNVSLQCTVGEYHVAEMDNYTFIHIDDGHDILKAGAPAVEQITTTIIVDDQKEMQVVVTNSQYEEFTNIYLHASKGNLSRLVNPLNVQETFGVEYNQNEFYPGNLASLGKAFVQGQFRGQSVHFHPVQYNPVTHVLRVYSQIEIDVVATEIDGENMLPSNTPTTIDATMREAYSDRYINYSGYSDRYDQIDEMGNILVITHAQYIEELEPWVQWKKEKGFPVEVVDVATIGSLNAINNFVEDYYFDNGLTYLVVVGDEDQVPVQMVNNSGGQGYCDACYGYISGNDSYSEIFVGRFLFHNDDELVPFIDKILEYEKNPDTSSDWFSVAMGIGSNEGDGFGDDNQADWEHQNGIKEELLDFTYTSVYERYDGSHGSSSPTGGATADASGGPAASTISSVINGGCSLINYTGHGAHDLIVTGSYTSTNIYALNNHGQYPYFIIVGCCTGDYDDDDDSGDTFGEAWIKTDNPSSPTGGIGGSFSSVYQSWSPPMEGQDEMNAIIAETASINTRHTMGSIHFHGCAGMNDEYGNDGDEMTDTWHLFGDPTVQLRTAMPTQLVASHPASVFIGATTLTVNCNTEDAMVGLTVNGEILATGFISGGLVALEFDALQGVDPILVTVTSFNTIPYQQNIEVVPADGPYVTGVFAGVHDLAGNNNGLPDYNEDITMDVNASNTGNDPATGVVGVISSNNTSVVLDNTSHNYGDIAAGGTVEGSGAFGFHIDGYIADQTVVTFTVVFTDSEGNSWTTLQNVTINAPVMNCVDEFVVIDDVNGNGNGRLDSGEMATVTIPVTNSGHAATAVDVIATLTENSNYMTVSGSPDNLGIIAAGATVNATFSVSIAVDAPVSHEVDFDFATTSDFYGSDCEYSKVANQNMEDWETGNDESFDWSYTGDADWFVTDSEAFEGTYSMQSGDIGNDETTTLMINTNFVEAGEISFMFKTSTEDSYDFLTFRIDNTEQGSWSGTTEWTMATYNVSAGAHTLRWIYEKDEIVSDGQDACWVDNITLPLSTPSAVTETPLNNVDVVLYPNPADEALNLLVSLDRTSDVQIEVYNAIGELVAVRSGIGQSAGMKNYSFNTSAWNAGVYFVNVLTVHGIKTERVVIR